MKSILMTVMLLIVAVMLYQATIGGSGGASDRVYERGQSSSRMIEEINP